MSEFAFLDSTVLGNFARVVRLDLLESILDARGLWTAAVEYEVTRKLPATTHAAIGRWLGEPVGIDNPAEIREVHRLRRVVFGGADTQSLQHLGEAETCFLLTERAEFVGSRWVIDNPEVLAFARRRGITTVQSNELLSQAVLEGKIAPDHAREVLIAMRCGG
ncbi:hypothetical protein [Nocardia cyriacigeorgica]|uniref:hypothetical protein n=1 Tax=Nocardia cyriacigeorgica TaxID=135487 RepID=UPI0024572A5C|nr:hypothetical protein [Nocardia cyriacigeorgica]